MFLFYTSIIFLIFGIPCIVPYLCLMYITLTNLDHFIDNKRKGDDIENPGSKTRRMDKKRCVDLIVLGLPWKSTEEDMRKYFSQFGELLLVQVK